MLSAIADMVLVRPAGIVRRVTPGRIEATGPAVTVGDLCRIGSAARLAEVVSVDADAITLVPLDDGNPVRLGDSIVAADGGGAARVGDAFAGRAIDALGQPIDGAGPIVAATTLPIRGTPPGVLSRQVPHTVLPTGVRAIDGLLTLGRGQRIGVFAASGVGKTSLIEQMLRGTPADRRILCLVGERGREVEGFWRSIAERSDRDRFTVVAATSDDSAGLRARSVATALCLAEYWRDRGEHVLLVIDSVTRLAMALREIGLAGGEPPTVRAYTPNVFAALPRVVERCGAVLGGGAITAVMTVLAESDEVDDPIVETMKSLLDGHIVLSRTLAERGHFPAIDVTRSVSRQASRLMAPTHAVAARAVAAQLGVYDEARVMIESGIYQAGTTPQIDVAIAQRPAVLAFLQQPEHEVVDFDAATRALAALGAARD